MRLLCDEDVGRSIPEALRALELGEVDYIRNLFRRRIKAGEFPDGVKDEDWIPLAGKGRWLVFSCNKRLLEAQAQRDLWIREDVGGIFLTSGQEKRREVMMMLLRRWDWLEQVDRHAPRPFAYVMPLSGTPKLDPRVTKG